MTKEEILKKIEDVLLLEPIIDKYRHTILNIKDVAKEIYNELY